MDKGELRDGDLGWKYCECGCHCHEVEIASTTFSCFNPLNGLPLRLSYDRLQEEFEDWQAVHDRVVVVATKKITALRRQLMKDEDVIRKYEEARYDSR